MSSPTGLISASILGCLPQPKIAAYYACKEMLKAPRRKSRTAIIIPITDPPAPAQALNPRKAIPKALREQVWRHHIGESYKAKCCVTWCTNQITPFDYEVGHNVPHSQGGGIELANLRPICGRCNRSMGDTYTIDQWNRLVAPAPSRCRWLCCCTSSVSAHSDQPSPPTTSASKST